MASFNAVAVVDLHIANTDLGIGQHRYRLRVPEGRVAVFKSLFNEEFGKAVVGVVAAVLGIECLYLLRENER